MKNRHQEQGFSMLELIIYITIVGIIVTIAVPKYTNAVTMANTAKVQADLQTIDTAVAMYQMQKGTYPSELGSNMSEYLPNMAHVVPPQGKCLLTSGETIEITATAYTLSDTKEAECQGHPAYDFGKRETTKVVEEK